MYHRVYVKQSRAVKLKLRVCPSLNAQFSKGFEMLCTARQWCNWVIDMYVTDEQLLAIFEIKKVSGGYPILHNLRVQFEMYQWSAESEEIYPVHNVVHHQRRRAWHDTVDSKYIECFS